MSDEKIIWDFLYKKIGNAYGAAAMMGNLYAESALRSTNLQTTYERKLGFTDSSYTEAVDDGSYSNFVRDAAGYGLAQWTYWSRKKALLSYALGKNKSIGDLEMQLEFLYKELSESYKSVLSALKSATSVRSASDVVLMKYERPADQSEKVQQKRASYGQKYYDKYANQKPVETRKVDYADERDDSLAGAYKTITNLHIRAGAGTSKESLDVLDAGTVVRNYGFYSFGPNGTKWLYVDVDGLVGFCSAKYLKRI